MPTLVAQWNLEVDRGPDGLWVRIVGPARGTLDRSSLADSLWSLLERHFVYRLVLDVEALDVCDDCLVEQLTDLCERISEHDGMLRLCGLSPRNRKALDRCESKGCIPCYRDREEAVMGGCPIKPR
jgi:anti-anti-sigma regulatory factor